MQIHKNNHTDTPTSNPHISYNIHISSLLWSHLNNIIYYFFKMPPFCMPYHRGSSSSSSNTYCGVNLKWVMMPFYSSHFFFMWLCTIFWNMQTINSIFVPTTSQFIVFFIPFSGCFVWQVIILSIAITSSTSSLGTPRKSCMMRRQHIFLYCTIRQNKKGVWKTYKQDIMKVRFTMKKFYWMRDEKDEGRKTDEKCELYE